jgi:hypothetical protein
MGQVPKTHLSDETVSDFGARLKKLQADVNRRLSTMNTDPLGSFTKQAAAGTKMSAMPAGFARHRAKNGG